MQDFILVGRFLVVLIILILYYYKILNWIRDSWVSYCSKKIWRIYKGENRWTLYDIENLCTLIFSIFLQLVLFFVIGLIMGFKFQILFSEKIHPLTMALGGAIGFSEMALSSGLVIIAMRLMILIRPSAPTSMHYWFVVLNSGWMRLFSRAEALLPRWQAWIVISAYVGVEEIIYRAVLISSLRPLGFTLSLFISTFIFAGYQIFNVPNIRAALYPMIGALLMGVVHGLIFIATGFIWPLVFAHIIFFISVSNSLDRS